MGTVYEKSFKKKVVEEIKKEGASTSETAIVYRVPLKTLEKWITAYNKDSRCFDEGYDPKEYMEKMRREIIKRRREEKKLSEK